jgi:hypothetical protein
MENVFVDILLIILTVGCSFVTAYVISTVILNRGYQLDSIIDTITMALSMILLLTIAYFIHEIVVMILNKMPKKKEADHTYRIDYIKTAYGAVGKITEYAV